MEETSTPKRDDERDDEQPLRKVHDSERLVKRRIPEAPLGGRVPDEEPLAK